MNYDYSLYYSYVNGEEMPHGLREGPGPILVSSLGDMPPKEEDLNRIFEPFFFDQGLR